MKLNENSFSGAALRSLLLLLRMIIFISQVGSWKAIFMMLNLVRANDK